jgi:cytidyltransferase-like protein
MEMTGVFWGAFDPVTKAHLRIITVCLEQLTLNQLIIVINNHSYKKYKFSLEDRMEKMRQGLSLKEQRKILLRFQDDSQKMDYKALVKITKKPICAIAGYDAYRSWKALSNPEDRALYQKIIVIPRGDENPILFDQNAEILSIEDCYKYVSSTNPNTPHTL